MKQKTSTAAATAASSQIDNNSYLKSGTTKPTKKRSHVDVSKANITKKLSIPKKYPRKSIDTSLSAGTGTGEKTIPVVDSSLRRSKRNKKPSLRVTLAVQSNLESSFSSIASPHISLPEEPTPRQTVSSTSDFPIDPSSERKQNETNMENGKLRTTTPTTTYSDDSAVLSALAVPHPDIMTLVPPPAAPPLLPLVEKEHYNMEDISDKAAVEGEEKADESMEIVDEEKRPETSKSAMKEQKKSSPSSAAGSVNRELDFDLSKKLPLSPKNESPKDKSSISISLIKTGKIHKHSTKLDQEPVEPSSCVGTVSAAPDDDEQVMRSTDVTKDRLATLQAVVEDKKSDVRTSKGSTASSINSEKGVTKKDNDSKAVGCPTKPRKPYPDDGLPAALDSSSREQALDESGWALGVDRQSMKDRVSLPPKAQTAAAKSSLVSTAKEAIEKGIISDGDKTTASLTAPNVELRNDVRMKVAVESLPKSSVSDKGMVSARTSFPLKSAKTDNISIEVKELHARKSSAQDEKQPLPENNETSKSVSEIVKITSHTESNHNKKGIAKNANHSINEEKDTESEIYSSMELSATLSTDATQSTENSGRVDTDNEWTKTAVMKSVSSIFDKQISKIPTVASAEQTSEPNLKHQQNATVVVEQKPAASLKRAVKSPVIGPDSNMIEKSDKTEKVAKKKATTFSLTEPSETYDDKKTVAKSILSKTDKHECSSIVKMDSSPPSTENSIQYKVKKPTKPVSIVKKKISPKPVLLPSSSSQGGSARNGGDSSSSVVNGKQTKSTVKLGMCNSKTTKRVRFVEPSQPLRTSGRNVRLLQLMQRRHQQSLRTTPMMEMADPNSSPNVTKATIAVSGPDKLRQQELVDELQYLLDGILKHDGSSSSKSSKSKSSNDRGTNKLVVSSLHSLVRLFLRKDGRTTGDASVGGDGGSAAGEAAVVSTRNALLGSNGNNGGGSSAHVLNDICRERGVVIDMLSAQPELLSKIMKRLCTMLGKTSCIDALIALLFVIIFKSAGPTLLITENEVESLLNMFVKNCALCLKKEEMHGRNRGINKSGLAGHDRKEDHQPSNSSNNSRKRGIFARKNDETKDAKRSLETLNELVIIAGVIEEDASSAGGSSGGSSYGSLNDGGVDGPPPFTNEAEGGAYLLGTGLALMIDSRTEVREWMRENRRLDRVVAAVYSSEALNSKWEGQINTKGNDDFNSSKKGLESSKVLCARDRSGWRIVLGGSLRILQYAALDEVCKARLTAQTRIVAISVAVVKWMGGVRIGGGLDSEWVICNALKLCINLMRRSDEEGLSQFVKVGGVNIVLNCLVSESIASKFVYVSTSKVGNDEDKNKISYGEDIDVNDGEERKVGDTIECEESFDIRVLCLALLASAVDLDTGACEAFPSIRPKALNDKVDALTVALEILTRCGEDVHQRVDNGGDGTGKLRQIKDGEHDGMMMLMTEEAQKTRKEGKDREKDKERETSPTPSSSSMDRKIMIGYVCLLIGALVRGNEKNRAILVERFSEDWLLRIAVVVQEFLDFHHDVGVQSASIDEMYEGIIMALKRGLIKDENKSIKDCVDVIKDEHNSIRDCVEVIKDEKNNIKDCVDVIKIDKRSKDCVDVIDEDTKENEGGNNEFVRNSGSEDNDDKGEKEGTEEKGKNEKSEKEDVMGKHDSRNEDMNIDESRTGTGCERDGVEGKEDENDEFGMNDVLGMDDVAQLDDFMEIDEVLSAHLSEFGDESRVC